MTINKSQGQTLQRVALDLREPCFSHGQLYVALGRVPEPTRILVLSTAQYKNKNNSQHHTTGTSDYSSGPCSLFIGPLGPQRAGSPSSQSQASHTPSIVWLSCGFGLELTTRRCLLLVSNHNQTLLAGKGGDSSTRCKSKDLE